MNKINNQILGNYLNEIGAGTLESASIASLNRGNGVFWAKCLGTKEWKKFMVVHAEITRRRIVLAALFPGLDAIEHGAMEREWTSDEAVHRYIMDWVRSQLLVRVLQIQNGEESCRGELRIMFSHAKSYFGNALDHGQEYRFFFSGAALEVMTHFKEVFKRISFK